MNQAMQALPFAHAGYPPLDVQHQDVIVSLERAADGSVTVLFDGQPTREFRFEKRLCLLVFHLETVGGASPAAFATAPLQFKDEAGDPVPVPACLQVTTAGPKRFAIFVLNTAIESESFNFYALLLFENRVIASRDPTIVLEPPPCTGSECPTDGPYRGVSAFAPGARR